MRTSFFCVIVAGILITSMPANGVESTLSLHRRIADLKKEIELLEVVRAKQSETIGEYQEFKKKFALLQAKSDSQGNEIMRLRGLCKQKGVNPNAPTPGNPADYCIYKGKEHDKKWFNNCGSPANCRGI